MSKDRVSEMLQKQLPPRRDAARRSFEMPAASPSTLAQIEVDNRQLLDHDPSAILHPVMDHTNGVEESDETQFFAYTLGHNLFKKGVSSTSHTVPIGVPTAEAVSKPVLSCLKSPRILTRPSSSFRRHIEQADSYGVDVRPEDTFKSDCAFVLVCTSKSEVALASTTALSLKRTATGAAIICMLAFTDWINNISMLQQHFDEVVDCYSLAQGTQLAHLLADNPLISLLLLWRLDCRCCVYVSSHCVALQCADTLFRNPTDFAAVSSEGVEDGFNMDVFVAKPDRRIFDQLVERVLESPQEDVFVLLNSFWRTRDTDITAVSTARLCSLYNFCSHHLISGYILPSVKVFNLSSSLRVWLSAGLPENASPAVRHLFGRWCHLLSLVEPVVSDGERPVAPSASVPRCCVKRVPWRITRASVERVVGAEHHRTRLRTITEPLY